MVTKCRTGKIIYPTWASAIRALATHRGDAPVKTYRCTKCWAWHLTSNNRRKPKQNR